MTNPATPSGPPMDFLERYMELRRQERFRLVADKYEKLTRRERRLIREAAVMGYVQGAMRANPTARPDIPGDREIVELILNECSGMPDLYPVIAHL